MGAAWSANGNEDPGVGGRVAETRPAEQGDERAKGVT